ncbi:hypothetical protein [Mesorhizobium sp. NZP2234]|uniref:hypothetical protein n=1 Tax=Mesorhizobium sp. NZP2234 TaxID=2483402 RepID=UPI00155769C3|nr:hypothetical protein [Mesorhizobium sp. NZP2234]
MTTVRNDGHRSKQNGPLFSGPFVSGIEPISWPVQAPERERALEPEQARVLVLVQGPELARAPVLALVPERALGPVCWRPALRRVPDARRFCRKRNTRQSPG